MPSCFQLFKKGSKRPEQFIQIDAALCAELNVHQEERAYYLYWYDSIGLRLACGQPLTEIVKDYIKMRDEAKSQDNKEFFSHMVTIAEFFAKNYTSKYWHDEDESHDNN